MEFAFSALLLLSLILPGFILQFTYTKGTWRWNSPNVSRPLSEQIPSGVVSAAFLHLIWATICGYFYQINLKVLTMLLLGNYGHDEEHFDEILENLSNSPYKITLYFLSLYALAAIIGFIFHKIVRVCKLDHKRRFFRFNNEWFYALGGELSKFTETKDIDGEIDVVWLTTIVHHEGKNVLYRGFIYDFYFDSEGHLDRVILTDVDRRDLSNDKNPKKTDENRFYEIEGDYFILRYSEMTTINLYYITFEAEVSPTVAEITVAQNSKESEEHSKSNLKDKSR